MKNLTRKITLIGLVLAIPLGMLAQAPHFQEAGGLVVIEMESAPAAGLWQLESSRVGYTGDGYLQYTGPDYFNDPGNSLITFLIDITKTGKYRFQWHSLIAVGQSNTEHNDSWLRFNDASDFYGQKDDTLRVYPKGVGKTPNPEGSSKDGWLKIYQNTRNNWTWQTRTSDRDPHDIYVEFDSVGTYTLEIAGRSNGHAINRMVLFHSDVNAGTALALGQPQSVQLNATSLDTYAFNPVRIWPSPANHTLHADISLMRNGGDINGEILNLQGQQVHEFSVRPDGTNEIDIPVRELPAGMYVIRLHQETTYYQGTFIKQ